MWGTRSGLKAKYVNIGFMKILSKMSFIYNIRVFIEKKKRKSNRPFVITYKLYIYCNSRVNSNSLSGESEDFFFEILFPNEYFPR